MNSAYQIRDYSTTHTRSVFTGLDPSGNILMNCVILELPWVDNEVQKSCCPEMVVKVKRRWSKKHKWHYQLMDIPDRELILQHAGNFTSDILGCQLPGSAFANLNGDNIPDVVNSRKTLDKMLQVMGEEYMLHIGSFNRPTFPHKIPVYLYSTIPYGRPHP